MKLKITTILGVACLAANLSRAETVAWDGGGGDDSWQTATNWDNDLVPNSADDITIGSAAAVTYTPGGDLIVDGGSLTINEGASWTQSPTNWTQINNGTLTLDNGTFTRTGGGNFVLAFNTGNSGIVSATDSTINLGGEIWFGHNINVENQTAQVTLSNSTINAGGAVGIWFWDTDAPGNSLVLNFSGASSTVNGRIGRRNSGGSDNAVTWETLWDEGVLQFNGSNSGAFSDYFVTTGTPGTIDYSLTSISENTSTLEITEIDYDPIADTVKLTWRRTGAGSYSAIYSTNMTAWDDKMKDDITDGLDEDTADTDHITVTFALADYGVENLEKLFFRIEEN